MYYSQDFRFKSYAPELGELARGNYPIFNDWWDTYIPEHKETLQTKILHSYWFNQIGQETPDRFAWQLNATLERIMPYYNKLYESELIKFDPIFNHFIKSNNRSIENMVREANTGTSKAAKSIRDFVSNGNTVGSLLNDFTGNYTRTLDKDVITDYTKDGTEDKIKDTVSNEVEQTDSTRETDFTQNVTEHETKDHDDSLQRQVDETKDHDDTLTRQEVTDRDTTSHMEQVGTSETDETTDTTRSGTKLYSDTPQRNTSNQSINTNYLTNYTQTSDTENVVHHSETDTTLTEDRTEQMEQTVDITETSTHDEVNQELTDETSTHDETNDKTTDTVSHETQTFTQTKETDFTEKVTEDNEWHEEGHEEEATDEYEVSGSNEVTQQGTRQDAFSKQREDEAESESTETKEDRKQMTDTGTDGITQGYMNVSPSQLLAQFRETFLNIDNMIIEELRPLFMEVF